MARTTTRRTSSAVMQRRAEPPDSLDYFPTPAWAVRAACRFLSGLGEDLGKQTCWEPACGEGHMVRPLREVFRSVRASDVFDYGGNEVLDFIGYSVWAKRDTVDWIITNPPFAAAEAFIKRARRLTRRGVVMVVRGAFVEGGDRYEALFQDEVAPSYVVTYSERVVMLRGRLIQPNQPDPFNYDEETFEPRRASSATHYTLVVWLPDQHDTRHRWIPPCRLELERPGDYPEYREQWEKLAALRAQASGQGVLL